MADLEEMTEGREVGWASNIEPGPLLTSKSKSVTDNTGNFMPYCYNMCYNWPILGHYSVIATGRSQACETIAKSHSHKQVNNIERSVFSGMSQTSALWY